MTEIDDVIQAKNAIQSLAIKLRTLDTTVSQLTGAKEHVDAVVRAADQVVELTGQFTTSSAEILSRLEGIDLESKLGEIREVMSGVTEKMASAHRVEEIHGELSAAIAALSESLTSVRQAVSTGATSQSTAISKLEASVKKKVQLGNLISGATLVLVLVLLALMFMK